ncbi:MAG: NUDIX domain-containing protein, partial [Terriglobia bacterium]
VRTWCLARRSGRPESYPQPRPRRPIEAHHLAIVAIRKGKRIAVTRGLAGGLLAELWNFPAAFGNSSQEALDNLQRKLQREIRSPITWGSPLGALQHRITYRSIRATIYAATMGDGADTTSLHWFTLNDLNGAAISQLARKAAEILRQA